MNDFRRKRKSRGSFNRRNGQSNVPSALDLEAKVAQRGGAWFGLERDEDDEAPSMDQEPTPGIFGRRVASSGTVTSLRRARLFATPSTKGGNPTARRAGEEPSRTITTNHSRRSLYSRLSSSRTPTRVSSAPGVHIVCAISENLARETCVASLDAGSVTTLQVTKQANGQTYAETLAYLQVLEPDEVLLNEGRRHSPLARKILDLYPCQSSNTTEIDTDESNRRRPRNRNESSRYGACETATTVKFLSRSSFDQTKGAELLRKIAREETYDATVVEEYILLSSAHAVLHYTQHCLGASIAKGCLHIMYSSGHHRMAMDRATILQLELLVNSKTGKVRDSLIGTLDCTKTTVGSRLLRTNLMSPPTRVDTIQSRLELVETFLAHEDFFYTVFEHLSSLPDVDKMLTNMALVPKTPRRESDDGGGGGAPVVNQRIASRGISALVCIKTTLTVLPAFAGVLQAQVNAMEAPTPNPPQRNRNRDDHTVVSNMTDRTSLLIGLGGQTSSATRLQRHHLLRAIIFSLTQPALAQVLNAVSDVFTETTTFTRNSSAMRHQECFALKCDEDALMSVLRKAFLANVDDIYKKADEYAEIYGMQVAVRYAASRGYYLAVPADVATDLPQVFLQPAKSGRFINCTTEEITSLNTRAQDNVNDLLYITYDQIQKVLDIARSQYDAMAALCDAVALLDMCHSFADTVTLSPLPWCRPMVSDRQSQQHGHSFAGDSSGDGGSVALDSGNAMVIRNGRYGIDVSNSGLKSANGPEEYIPNDTFAAHGKDFTLITGINGSGKSTYLKQIAIIVILAHCGSYVPAEQASIPVRDQLCTRIGNADDQEHNISTFMLEMKETAFICNHTTDKSLVLVDELGRATSNEDGVAIAWSVAEYLLKKRAMTFFVTHYPQLSRLGAIYPSVQNMHMEASVARGEDGKISYTHKVKAGACSVSTDYGVELAAACGWPSDLVQNARSTESQVETLLPNQDLCQSQSSSNRADPRVEAYHVVETLRHDLKELVTSDQPRSFAAVRSALMELHQNAVPAPDTELFEHVDKLLFRESEYRRLASLRPVVPAEDVLTRPVHQLPSQSNRLGLFRTEDASYPGHTSGCGRESGYDDAPMQAEERSAHGAEGSIVRSLDKYPASARDENQLAAISQGAVSASAAAGHVDNSETSSLSSSSSGSDSSGDSSSTSSSDDSRSAMKH